MRAVVRRLEAGEHAQQRGLAAAGRARAARRTRSRGCRATRRRRATTGPKRLVTPSISSERLGHRATGPRLTALRHEQRGDADRHDDRGERVDLGRDAEADHRIDLHRQRGRGAPGAGGEEGDDELVDREREGEQRAGDDGRQDHRQGHAAEGGAAAEAPRSVEASTIEQSKIFSRARTTRQTKARSKTTWARMIVCRPERDVEQREEARAARWPSTMSGMIIGAKTQRLEPGRRAGRALDAEREQRAEQRGERGRRRRDDDQRVEGGAQDLAVARASATYHLIEKPDQAVGRPHFVEGERDQHSDRHVEERRRRAPSSRSQRRRVAEPRLSHRVADSGATRSIEP